MPAAPSNLVVVRVAPIWNRLTWTNNSVSQAGVAIERCRGVGCGGFVEIARVSGPSTTYSYPAGLLRGRSFTYRVRAWNAAGMSPYSNTATLTTTVQKP